jgi:hypothetical protein
MKKANLLNSLVGPKFVLLKFTLNKEVTPMSKKRKKGSKESRKVKFEIHDDIDSEIFEEESSSQLETFRIGHDDKAGVLFTKKHQSVYVHYCAESEIKCYVVCNSDGGSDNCLFCQIGKKRNKRLLFPVFSLETETVEVLPVSDSLRPYALLPQMLNILSVDKKLVTFFSHENYKYLLTTRKLNKERRRLVTPIVKSFMKSWEAQEIDLSDVYQRISNSTAANYTEIRKMVDLKGINIDELDD